MKLKQYPEYKEVKLPWINKLPLEWKVLRAKTIFKPINIRSKTGEEELLSVSEKKGVSLRKNINVTMFKAESYKGYKLCWPGDLVINSLWAWMQGLGFSKYHGIISTAYGVYRLKNKYQFEYKYFDYLLRSSAYLWELRIRSKGIWKSRYQLTDDAFMTMPIIIPSKSERRRIVRFLDFKCTRIAKFIRNKHRLIKLLKEQKQVIINQAVTQGLNPDVKMKPSGIDWLGDIPEHWDVVPLRWYIFISSGEFRSTEQVSNYQAENCRYPVIGGNGVMGYTNEYNSTEETIVLGRVGALCGNVHLIKECAWITDNALRIRKIKQFFIDYLVEQLRVMNLNILSNSSAQPLITGEIVKSQKVALPPIEEQKTILTSIGERTSNIDLAIEKAKREIELIQEYRTSLVSDVVTGKLDVRNINADNVSDEEIINGSFINEETKDLNNSIKEVSNEH